MRKTSLSSTEPGGLGQAFCNIFALFLLACPLSQAEAFTPPAPSDMPDAITVKGKEIALKDLKNPLRESPDKLKELSQQGGEIYFRNCFLCHGDLLDGKGVFGQRLFPPAADFGLPEALPSKPEAYAYWRIMKGGKGLPKKFQPWDSAMPAWEDHLEEEDVWKVILFIYDNADDKWERALNDDQEPSVNRGRTLYKDKCAYCHGAKGGGDGPSAKYSSPKPRKLYKGQYKIRSTPFGKIPTDQDLFDMITNGYPGTSMPSWKHLSITDRWSLVLYLKKLSKKFEKFVKRGKTHQLIQVPEPPPFTLESVASGKQLFVQNCSGCHGVKGRGDGASTHKIVDLDADTIWPRNLTKPWTFRRGATRKKLFMTLRTGLSTSAMPRFSGRIFKDQQIWDLVHYVQTLSPSQKPPLKPTIKVEKVSGELPTTPDHPIWKEKDAYFFPLFGQIMEPKKSYYPVHDGLKVKAVRNGADIAFLLYWDDPHPDPILSTLTSVKESPAPPLPPELQVEEEEEETPAETEPQEFPDSIALQFPVNLSPDGEKPNFLNGDPNHPVNLWQWSSHPMQASEINARGLDKWERQPEASQGVDSKVFYRYGRYYLVMKRKLTTDDVSNDIQFRAGEKIPIAFNVWDGSQGQTGSKKSVSSWFEMVLE